MLLGTVWTDGSVGPAGVCRGPLGAAWSTGVARRFRHFRLLLFFLHFFFAAAAAGGLGEPARSRADPVAMLATTTATAIDAVIAPTAMTRPRRARGLTGLPRSRTQAIFPHIAAGDKGCRYLSA